MNRDESRSAFPRLDILDSILEPCVDPEFIRFVDRNPEMSIALVVIGAAECGVTKPKNWADMRTILERAAREYIERYINERLSGERDA